MTSSFSTFGPSGSQMGTSGLKLVLTASSSVGNLPTHSSLKLRISSHGQNLVLLIKIQYIIKLEDST